jgi:hypothetical protein
VGCRSLSSEAPLGAHYCKSSPIDTHRIASCVVDFLLLEGFLGEVVHVVEVESQKAVPERFVPALDIIVLSWDSEAREVKLRDSVVSKHTQTQSNIMQLKSPSSDKSPGQLTLTSLLPGFLCRRPLLTFLGLPMPRPRTHFM